MSDTSLARVHTIDAVRGVAVMGILLMNIVAFGMPEAAYMNPTAYGGAHGVDLAVYLINFVLFDGKMRGLFSFLFGASMLLVIERAEAKDEDPAVVHFSRMAWLLVFGLAHLWLIWWGDILSLYAPVGMIAFMLRDKPIPRLLSLGLVLILFQALVITAITADVLITHGKAQLPRAPARLLEVYRAYRQLFGTFTPEELARNLGIFRGGYGQILVTRFAEMKTSPLTSLLVFGAETLAYMAFGMAALRSGLLTGEWERARLIRWTIRSFAIGIPGYALLAAIVVAYDFSLPAVTICVFALPVLLRPAMIVGWMCLIVLLVRSGDALVERLAATGRMAFTNYLTTSLVCTTFFYGYGFGWYGFLSRAQLYLVVLAMWAAMLLWSKPWLARFRYGPFEWLWRTLSRRKLQPISGAAA